MRNNEEQQLLILIIMTIIIILYNILGSIRLLLISSIILLLSTRKPSILSFNPYIERWFKNEYFPQLSERLRQELEQRASNPNQSFFDSLRDTGYSLLVGTTKELSSTIQWEAIRARNLPNVKFYDLFFMRRAILDISVPLSIGGGNSSNNNNDNEHEPVILEWWGIFDHWFLAPYLRIDFDRASVLGGNNNNTNSGAFPTTSSSQTIRRRRASTDNNNNETDNDSYLYQGLEGW